VSPVRFSGPTRCAGGGSSGGAGGIDARETARPTSAGGSGGEAGGMDDGSTREDDAAERWSEATGPTLRHPAGRPVRAARLSSLRRALAHVVARWSAGLSFGDWVCLCCDGDC
jgi:hypothetical protein